MLPILGCFGVSDCTPLACCVGDLSVYSIPVRHHAWVSFEAMAEVYNEVNRLTANINFLRLKEYLSSHPLKKMEGIKHMCFLILSTV